MSYVVDPKLIVNIPPGKELFVGPWKCEKCHHESQFAIIKWGINRIFCKNPSCGFERTIDKKRHIIIEDDGSVWAFDPSDGSKRQVRSG